MADVRLYDMLEQLGLTNIVYEAMRHSDVSQVVMAAADILEMVGALPILVKECKSERISTDLRNKGNLHYKHREYRKALMHYNLALKYAPNKSEPMKFAYSNRSAVLLAVDAFNACLKDIDTCVDMNCSLDIIEKLRKRQRECYTRGETEMCRDLMFLSDGFANNYFKFNVKRNSKVPCVSIDVDITSDETGASKVAAANDIQVGTVVAVEEAFVSVLSDENENLSCYYCNKMAFHLTPCEGCCVALFCSTDCKERCMHDYHRIECQIADYYNAIKLNPVNKLSIKAMIKFSLKCNSWQELISASMNIGASRMKNSTVNEIYDAKNKFSILNFNDDKRFIHGRMYTGSFVCASVLNCLSKVPNYLPQSVPEKDAALRALATIMMKLYIFFTNKINICTSAYNYCLDKIVFAGQINYGWFSFTNKLKHACEPNLLVTGLNNKVALVALKAIKRGEELNISYIGHWYNYTLPTIHKLHVNHRRMLLFCATQVACRCRICDDQWNLHTAKQCNNLNEKQKKCYKNLISASNRNSRSAVTTFNAACQALNGLRGLENTKQHCEAFLAFQIGLNLFQFNETNNTTVT